MELIVFIGGAFASFIGNWFALKVHISYLRRDVDLAHKRIDELLKA